MVRIEIFQLEIDRLVDQDSYRRIGTHRRLRQYRLFGRIGRLVGRSQLCIRFLASFTLYAISRRKFQGCFSELKRVLWVEALQPRPEIQHIAFGPTSEAVPNSLAQVHRERRRPLRSVATNGVSR